MVTGRIAGPGARSSRRWTLPTGSSRLAEQPGHERGPTLDEPVQPQRMGEVKTRPLPSLLLTAGRAGPWVARPGCSDRAQAIALRRKGGRVGGGTRRGGSWANRSVVASAILRTAASKANSVVAEVDCTPLTFRTY